MEGKLERPSDSKTYNAWTHRATFNKYTHNNEFKSYYMDTYEGLNLNALGQIKFSG